MIATVKDTWTKTNQFIPNRSEISTNVGFLIPVRKVSKNKKISYEIRAVRHLIPAHALKFISTPRSGDKLILKGGEIGLFSNLFQYYCFRKKDKNFDPTV